MQDENLKLRTTLKKNEHAGQQRSPQPHFVGWMLHNVRLRGNARLIFKLIALALRRPAQPHFEKLMGWLWLFLMQRMPILWKTSKASCNRVMAASAVTPASTSCAVHKALLPDYTWRTLPTLTLLRGLMPAHLGRTAIGMAKRKNVANLQCLMVYTLYVGSSIQLSTHIYTHGLDHACASWSWQLARQQTEDHCTGPPLTMKRCSARRTCHEVLHCLP